MNWQSKLYHKYRLDKPVIKINSDFTGLLLSKSSNSAKSPDFVVIKQRYLTAHKTLPNVVKNYTQRLLRDCNKIATRSGDFCRTFGRKIYTLPEHYLVEFNRKGFPQGKLGILLGTMYEIRLNGLEYLLKDI